MSVASGLVIGQLGMGWAIGITVAILTIGLIHVVTLKFPKEKIEDQPHDTPRKVDLKGTYKVVIGIHGLMGLIFFSMFNNFL